MNLPNENIVPPRCFYFIVKETGVRIPQTGTTSLYGCYSQVRDHLHGNGYMIPSGLREAIEDFCCRNTEPGICQEDHRMPVEQSASFSLALKRIMQGAKSLASWWSEGMEDETTAAGRAADCRTCPENLPIEKSSCSGCQAAALNRFLQFVEGVLKGRRIEEWEKGLEACRVCGCPLRMKVRTKLAPIRRYMSSAQLKALPPTCWINMEKSE